MAYTTCGYQGQAAVVTLMYVLIALPAVIYGLILVGGLAWQLLRIWRR